MIPISQYVESKKLYYNALPIAVRWIIISISFVLGVVGLMLVFTPPPLFDIGALLLLLSLSVLSFQFKWAHTSLVYLNKKLADKAFLKKLFAIMGIVFLVIVGLIVYGFISK